MKGTKTINVDDLIDYANEQLAIKDSYHDKKYKEAVICMIEHVLRETNNYRGFMFINNDDSECNTIGHLERKYFKSK